jgi:hypothetical protein
MRAAAATVLTIALAACNSEQHDRVPIPPPVQTAETKPSIVEVPSDTELASALGVMMRTVNVKYPPNVKISVTTRAFRGGVLDPTISSRQVHGGTMNTNGQFLTLGWFDPDETNPQPQNKIKILGLPGQIWIAKPMGENVGGFLNVQNLGEIAIGEEKLLMELVYGSAVAQSSLGPSNDDFRESALIRVTVNLLVEPLTANDREVLKKQQNFNAAFGVDK